MFGASEVLGGGRSAKMDFTNQFTRTGEFDLNTGVGLRNTTQSACPVGTAPAPGIPKVRSNPGRTPRRGRFARPRCGWDFPGRVARATSEGEG